MYFPLLSLHGWGERLGEGRRHNCAVRSFTAKKVSWEGIAQKAVFWRKRHDTIVYLML